MNHVDKKDYEEVLSGLSLNDLKIELSEITLHDIALNNRLQRTIKELDDIQYNSDDYNKKISKVGRIVVEKDFTLEKKYIVLNHINILSQKLYEENQRKAFNKE